MTGGAPRGYRAHSVDTDLVGYIVIALPSLDSMSTVGSALAELVRAATIRVLDLVVISNDPDGTVVVLELEAVESLRALSGLQGDVSGLLSDHDVELVALALSPGTAAVVVVTEDRWAGSLSVAARQAGGQILAGERIPPIRVEAALANGSDE